MRVMLVTGFFPGEKMGGAEYQTLLMARGLAARGHDVTFLATRAETRNVSSVDGITLWEIPGWHVTGWEQHKQNVAEAVRETQPQICYVRLLTELANMTAVCRPAHVPVVSVSCSLKETTPFLTGYHPRETIGYLRTGQTLPHYRSFRAIGETAVHVCNTYDLQRKVQRWYPTKRIEVIYNGSPEPPPEEIHREASGQIIWVNNFKRGKRPELYIELARRLPQYKFVMVGGIPKHGRYGRAMQNAVKQAPSNLNHLGALPVDEVNRLIGRSDLLLYTSRKGVEGFGNSFLQAWFRAVPTISLSFELDGILEAEGVGRFCRTFDELVEAVDVLMSDEAARMAMGERARAYAMQNYRTGRMVADYEALFAEIIGQQEAVPSYGQAV